RRARGGAPPHSRGRARLAFGARGRSPGHRAARVSHQALARGAAHPRAPRGLPRSRRRRRARRRDDVARAIEGSPARVEPLVKRCERIDVECGARGYIAGSGWTEYKALGTVASETLPKGLEESQRLDEPIFTPATKAVTGHDVNISRAQLSSLVGSELAKELEDTTLELYRKAHAYALGRGLILADTKFEFGFYDGKLTLIDEALTPDSSRYWDAASYKPGGSPPSYDKQYVRDFLVQSGWNKEPPEPA